MIYAGSARLTPDASKARLFELRGRLERMGCQVQFDQGKTRLEFELLDNDSLWLTTGQLTLLFLSYRDVVDAPEHGYRNAETEGRLQA